MAFDSRINDKKFCGVIAILNLKILFIMTEALVVSIMIEAMRMASLLAAPMLIGALVVGLIVSIFQAVTQIQEQTLAIIPKMGALIAILAILFPWLLSHATTYMAGIFNNLPRYINF